MYDQDGVWINTLPRAGGIGYQSYDADAVSRETGLSCEGYEDMAQQQFKEECDINEIVRRFGLTGEMPGDFRAPVSGDFTGVTDFQTAMNAVVQAQEEFNRMPPEIRARFANDPQKLLEFVADEGNRQEADKLGLLGKKPEVIRDVVQAVDELAAKLTADKK